MLGAGDIVNSLKIFSYIYTLHYTKLHYTTLHYTTLHYTTPHYSTLHHTTPTLSPQVSESMALDTPLFTAPGDTLHWVSLHFLRGILGFASRENSNITSNFGLCKYMYLMQFEMAQLKTHLKTTFMHAL